MNTKLLSFLLLMGVALSARPCTAMDASLGSRKFDKIAIVVYDAQSDCSSFISAAATRDHINEYLAAHASPFLTVFDSDTSPYLSVKADCMHLVDTRGEGRTVGYSLSINVQFVRPFYEDITYVFAATWSQSTLLYIASDKVMQKDFDEQLDLLLEEFTSLWLDEHNKLENTDNIR